MLKVCLIRVPCNEPKVYYADGYLLEAVTLLILWGESIVVANQQVVKLEIVVDETGLVNLL